jgi:hypothetical protein
MHECYMKSKWHKLKDYQLTVLADCCVDRDEEVQRVLLSKVFPRQAEVVQAEAWRSKLNPGVHLRAFRLAVVSRFINHAQCKCTREFYQLSFLSVQHVSKNGIF